MIELVPPTEPLSQGDIFDEVTILRPQTDGTILRYQSRIIVLTQSCDLAQSKAKRVVTSVIHDAADFVALGEVKSSAVRDQIRRGLMFGLYFLPEAPNCNLPEMIVDLRDLHTIPRDVLESLAASGKRPARLITPFREHLAQHFAVTYMRIALPDPYPTNP